MNKRNSTPLPTLLRGLRWALAAFALLLVALVLAAPLIPWNFLKGPITDRVEAMTGRELDIAGDVSVSLLPQPQLSLNQVEFANADWATHPQMLTIKRLEIEPSLTRLITGELALDQVAVTDPVLHLENREGKPGNWVLPAMTAPGTSASGTQGSEARAGPPIRVEQFNVSDAEVRYLASGMEHPHILSLASLRTSGKQISLDGEAHLVVGAERRAVPVALSATVDPGFADDQWRLTDIQARMGEVRLTGNIGVDAGAAPPVITGKLHAPSINVSNILAALPDSGQGGPATASVPVLPSLAGGIQLSAEKVILAPATFTNVDARIRAGQHQVVLETLNFALASGTGEAAARLTSNSEFIAGRARLALQGIDLQALGLGGLSGQVDSAELTLALDRIPQPPSVSLKSLLKQVDTGVSTASYRTMSQNTGATTDLKLTLEQAGKPSSPVLSVTGQVQGRPLDMTIEGAPLPQLADNLAEYRLQAQAQSGELMAWADTRLGALRTLPSFAGNLMLKGDGGQELEAWTGAALPPLPEFRLSGRVSHEGKLWAATSLEGNIGATELSGDVHVRTTSPPEVKVDLEAGRIKLAQFMDKPTPAGASTQRGAEANGDSPLSALRAFNSQLNLRADALVLPNALELKEVQVVANLDSGKLRIEPLDFRVAGGSWESALTLDATSTPASGALDSGFEEIALSQFGQTFTAVEERLGKLSGELHLDLTETLPVDHNPDLLLPFIGRLTFDASQLHFTDPEAGTKLTFDLQTRGLETGDQAFHLDGKGRYDGAPFSLRFRGDPLLAARDPDRPYALELTSKAVDSRIQAQGTVLQPLALKGLDLELALEGPSPHRLRRLLGVPLPTLPPYSVSGDLSLKDHRWSLGNIKGTVGESDLRGDLAFDTGARPPHFTGDLHSTSLNLADLGVLAGSEKAPTGASAKDRYVLPDRTLITPAWQEVTADVRYRGTNVRAADIPLSNVVLDFELEDGRARLEPVRFGVGDGKVDFNLDIDTKTTPPAGTLKLKVQAVDLRRALRNWPIASESTGIVGAQGKFWVTGRSLAELFGSADGGLVIIMTQGKLNALLVELAGLDLAESVLVWLGDQDPVPIDCAYIDLLAREGVARIDTLAVDTADTRFTGTGSVNLNNERLDITVFSEPKDVSALSARSPLHIGGTFNSPDLGVQEGDLALQAGSSAVLGAVAAPVAALLPLLDLGTGEEVRYCSGLASRSLEAIDETSNSEDEVNHNEE